MPKAMSFDPVPPLEEVLDRYGLTLLEPGRDPRVEDGDFALTTELAWVNLTRTELTADAVSAWESADLSTAPKPAQ